MKWKSEGWFSLAALLLCIGLVACGDASPPPGADSASLATATPIPTFTPAPTAPPLQNMITSQAISGTITEFDPATKTLALQDSDSKSTKYGLDQASVSKSETLSATEFGAALNDSVIVQLSGEKGADGTFSAQSLTLLLDMEGANMAVVAGPGGDAPGKGDIQAGDTLTPLALTPGMQTPGNQVVGFNGTPGSPPPSGKGATFMVGGPGVNFLLLKNAKLDGNVLTGDNLAGGQTIANLGQATLFSRRVKGSLQDLKVGQIVTLNVSPARGDTPPQALHVTIN